MAEYKEIHGTKIRNYTTNPDNPITGEVWYNDTDNVLKFQYPNTTTSGSWRTGGNLNTGRSRPGSAGVSNSSALAFGGESPPYRTQTEQYDGSSWTEVNDLNVQKANFTGCGTVTAALASGGDDGSGPDEATNEQWNGTNWTEVGDLNNARAGLGQAGTTTSSVVFGGVPSPRAVTESWNGSTWTEVADLNNGRYYGGSAGTDSTSALYFGGATPNTADTESWNGSAWTEVNNLNTARTSIR